MQSSHAATAVDVAFDDPNLIADVGLVPVLALAERIGLPDLIAEHVAIASDEDVASLAQATSRLRQVWAELRDQQWEHCLATSRRALENIFRLVSIPSAKRVADASAAQRSQGQRWVAIYWVVKSMADAAHHDNSTTEGFSWSRADAEAILATAGLLGKYAQR
ncbi:MAG: hypothetical protein QG671_3870 [Actinomycetota bacterium]|nr:hypothetical protein [Actinomycetota bacterium]